MNLQTTWIWESITAFNNSLNNFKGPLLCSTSDHAFSQSLGTRIVELTPSGVIDRHMLFDEYMTDPKIKEYAPSFPAVLSKDKIGADYNNGDNHTHYFNRFPRGDIHLFCVVCT